MEKEVGSIRWTEVENGIRIEVTGDKFVELVNKCG
jgi:hypothetical protein